MAHELILAAMTVNKQHTSIADRVPAGLIGPWIPVVITGLVVWAMCCGPLSAGTIRHDRDPSLYTSLAAMTQYDSAGMVHLGGSVGSGTLIASQWVLTAGHMAGDDATFTVDGMTYQSDSGGYWRHPSEDIGIFRLSYPVLGVLPATLYGPSLGSEVGLDGTMVGFGYTGPGDVGEDIIYGPLGTKRAGQNSIDATGTFFPGWSPNLLLVDFDKPNDPEGQYSTMGLSSPLDLEMGPAHGDSGCGLFVELGGQTYLAGVQSEMWYNDGTANADYGDGGVFVSVRQTIDWIESIAPLNRPPLAVDDSYSVGEDQWLDAEPSGHPQDVLANDSDPNGNPIYANLYEGPSHGSLSLGSDGSFTYLAGENYFGPDSFSYRAYDGQAYSQPATVTIDVTPINDAPLAVDDSYEVEYGDEFSAVEGVLANDSDVEDDELTAVLRDHPEHGTVELQDNGTFVYRPGAFFSGEDDFAYLAYDDQVYSRLSTVSILVNPAPLAGDANRDNVVDAADVGILIDNWQTAGAGWSGGDFNSDGIVDDADATILAANWLAVPAPQVAVPEPDKLALVGGLIFCGAFFVLLQLLNGPFTNGDPFGRVIGSKDRHGRETD